MTKKKIYKSDDTPKPRTISEKIGDREWDLTEISLDIVKDIRLWENNPRLQSHLLPTQVSSEEEVEAALQNTRGYDTLLKSIKDIGQMESIYVWRKEPKGKYLVIEGATRVTVLRDLVRKQLGTNRVRAKVLPAEFGELERVILLARIHVRGTGVQAWGRYIEAKFIHEHVCGSNGKPPLLTVTEMARYLLKSVSWVQRLRDAYEFAKHFVEYLDTDDAQREAALHFSTLEEIAKAANIGPKVRDYGNEKFNGLRSEVFDMVKNRVFKEYRDARFMQEFYEDPDKWQELKKGEEHAAHRLANELKSNASSLKAKIAGLQAQIERALDRDDHGLGEEEVEQLQKAAQTLDSSLHPGVRPFRSQFVRITTFLSDDFSLADVKSLTEEEMEKFEESIDFFRGLVSKHKAKASA